jgi:glycosyltransferase involved in cell wall biosynthesis
MRSVVRQRPAAHLVIVGGSAGFAGRSGTASPEEAELLSIVEANGLGAHVTFTGRIPHADVKEMYALADVAAYPRKFTRTTALTTPLKPLEAMAMAKAVITSDVPPMRELVADGTTGLLFRAGDVHDLARQCSRLLCHAELRRQLGNGAREWAVRERLWPALVARYAPLYQSLARKAPLPFRSKPADRRVAARVSH